MIYVEEKGRIPSGAFDLTSRAMEDPESVFVLMPCGLAVAEALRTLERAVVPDMPDRVIAATAVAHHLPVLTCDRQIQASSVETIW